MIKALKRWVKGIVHEEISPAKVVPHPIANGAPFIQIYKIGNGYIFYRSNGQYRDDGQTAIYCATPMEVARQIVSSEALQKMGIDNVPQELQTTGRATGSFVNQI